MTEYGRKLLQAVEIDVDQCTRAYGSAPCAAVLGTTGARKCFNTRRTCQDPANYNKASLTLRFARNQGGLPKGETVFPALRSVSTRPSTINLSGIDAKQGPFGSRAEVTIDIDDFTDADFITDPYQAERVSGAAQADAVGYQPKDRGTFWGKLRARSYFLGRPLRVREGYVGQAWADMRTRHYVIAQIDGPDGTGGVSIRARDILDLADNKKTVAPAPSVGQLSADMGAGDLAFTLAGTGSDYAASGRIVIGSEIMTYTRSGEAFTITARGVDGSEVAEHDAGDTVQQCLRYEGQTVHAVANDLLTRAGVDASFIPYSDWEDEGDRWAAALRLTVTITEPTGVSALLGEIALLGVYWWWDEVAQEIKYRVQRPLDIGETYQSATDDPGPTYPDAAHIVRESARLDRPEDRRVSQAFMWHGILNMADDIDNPSNYARLAVTLSDDDANKYNQPRVRQMFTRWLGRAGDDSVAQSTTNRLVSRFADTPQVLSFTADAKDAARMELGTLIEVYSRTITDETGAVLGQPMQVSAVEETVGGHSLKVTAETFSFVSRYGFITEDSRPDYDASSAAQQAQGIYIGDSFADGTGPYRIF